MKEEVVKLDYRCTWNSTMYVCDITDEINEYFDVSTTLKGVYEKLKCPVTQVGYYVIAEGVPGVALAIRRPGSTVGAIYCDENNVITNINVDFLEEPELSKKLQKYVGCKIEYPSYNIAEFKNMGRSKNS